MMNIFTTLWITICYIIFDARAISSSSSDTSASPVADLDYGSFQGIIDGDITRFLGVPFAEAPYVTKYLCGSIYSSEFFPKYWNVALHPAAAAK